MTAACVASITTKCVLLPEEKRVCTLFTENIQTDGNSRRSGDKVSSIGKINLIILTSREYKYDWSHYYINWFTTTTDRAA